MTEFTSPVSPPPRTETGTDQGTASLTAPAPAPTSTPDAAANTESAAALTEPQERERVRDPNLSVLEAMFPDFDESLLQSVLDSVGGNSDRAIDVLLGMSDPEYRSDVRHQEQEQQPALSQEDLDARLAQQLYMEDQQAQAAWQAQQQRPRPVFNSGRRASQMQQEPEKDTMAELGDQFNKIAESGKRTFGNIFSKVKAKIAELDQSRQEGSSSTGASGAGGDTYAYESDQYSYPAAQQQQQQHSRHQRMQQHQQLLQQQAARQQYQSQQPAYYDPNATSSESPPPSAGGYDATPNSNPRTPPTSSGIDAGKLGLLPKKPVSLLRAQSPTQSHSPPADGASGHPARISTEQLARQNSDSDELYADFEPELELEEGEGGDGGDPFGDEHAHAYALEHGAGKTPESGITSGKEEIKREGDTTETSAK